MADREKRQPLETVPVAGKEQVGGVSSARRRLVKGAALAMPAIMTLRSGAARAVESLTCWDKRPTLDLNMLDEPWVIEVTETSGTLLRQQTVGYVKDGEIKVYVDNILNPQVYRFAETGYIIRDDAGDPKLDLNLTGFTEIPVNAVVIFDEFGGVMLSMGSDNINGVTINGQPNTASCWTSINMAGVG